MPKTISYGDVVHDINRRGVDYVEVELVLNGHEKWGFQYWTHVPRVGDYILTDGGSIKARVDNVVWGDGPIPQHVTLYCTGEQTDEQE